MDFVFVLLGFAIFLFGLVLGLVIGLWELERRRPLTIGDLVKSDPNRWQWKSEWMRDP